MTLGQLLSIASSPILTDGAILERVRRNTAVNLDPNVLHAALLFDRPGRELLKQISSEYLQIAVENALPILLITATFRSDPDRCASARLDFNQLHQHAVGVLRELKQEVGSFGDQVLIAGALGPKNDAYNPSTSLSLAEASEYHLRQAHALVQAGADLLLPLTFCAAPEARGVAYAVAQTGCPYVISLLPDACGNLLDRTPLEDLIAEIDAETDRPPLGYMFNCCHSSVANATLSVLRKRAPKIVARIIGLKANTSSRSPSELEGLEQLETEAPEVFGEAVSQIGTEFDLKLLGGCCGTDGSHLSALAKRLKSVTTHG